MSKGYTITLTLSVHFMPVVKFFSNVPERNLYSVLVEKDLLKRSEWPLASQKLIYGRDGVVRSAQIVTKEQASRNRKGSPSYIVRSAVGGNTPSGSIPIREEEQGGGPKLGIKVK